MSEDTHEKAQKEFFAKDEIFFPDLTELWKEFYFKNENSWAEVLKEVITKDTFVHMLDKTLDSHLSNEKLMRQNMDKYFEQSPFPSKKDIARLAEMIVSVEEKVEVLDDQLVDAVKSMANGMLAMAEAQKRSREEIVALRQDIADLSKKLAPLDNEIKNTPEEPRAKKSSQSKGKKKHANSAGELIL
jgi:polyhydroxyalkanoic acid synthase PhaR subunit